MQTVAIVDFSFGNLRSVHNALRSLAGPETDIRIATEPTDIEQADRIVFPGQGAARHCMLALRQKSLADAVLDAAQSRPFLGICMGMQVLMEYSEENDGVDCLGLFSGRVQAFAPHVERGSGFKIPHMGWSRIEQTPHPLWENIPDQSRFYFVHSYYTAPRDEEAIAGRTDYVLPFASVIAKDQVFAMQSHPEKSGEHGLTLLRNFLNWDGQC